METEKEELEEEKEKKMERGRRWREEKEKAQTTTGSVRVCQHPTMVVAGRSTVAVLFCTVCVRVCVCVCLHVAMRYRVDGTIVLTTRSSITWAFPA
jgi:hypothetical protein